MDYDVQAVEMPGTRRLGQTGIIRRAGYEDNLVSIPKTMPHVRTVYDAFQHGLKLDPDADCLGERKYNSLTGSFGQYEWQSYATIHTRLTRFGSGLLHLHHQMLSSAVPAQQQWTVGIWGPNRREWTIAGAACSAYNLISVGLFDALDIDAIVFIINHAEAPVIVTGGTHLAELLRNADKMPRLKVIISMDRLEGTNVTNAPNQSSTASNNGICSLAEEKGIRLLDFDEVEHLGELHGRVHVPPNPNDLYTIAYTSGTTGVPKGAMITHANYVAFLASSEDTIPVKKGDTVFNFAPLGHVFGRMVEAMSFSAGARAGYSSGSPLRLLEDAQALHPTMLPMVPRLLNRIYARLREITVGAPGVVGTLARKAVADKLRRYYAGQGLSHPIWDRLLFNKVRKVLGGNVQYMATGSAPISSEILAFCRIAFCCDIIEGYGQTENCGGSAITNFGDVSSGHVGPPNPSSEIKLIDVPALNYYSTDKPFPRGEICVRGPTVIKGYLKDEKQSREAIDEDGFLHSGDVAVLNANGTLSIIDRVKNIFKLSQGEYIAAEKIENQILAKAPLIQQIFVHGDSHESCLIAILVPEPEVFLPTIKKILGKEVSLNDLSAFRDACNDPKIRMFMLLAIANAGKNAGLKGFELPKAILIEPTPFSIENGHLTPTFKAKRHSIVQTYREQFTAMYNELHQQQSRL